MGTEIETNTSLTVERTESSYVITTPITTRLYAYLEHNNFQRLIMLTTEVADGLSVSEILFYGNESLDTPTHRNIQFEDEKVPNSVFVMTNMKSKSFIVDDNSLLPKLKDHERITFSELPPEFQTALCAHFANAAAHQELIKQLGKAEIDMHRGIAQLGGKIKIEDAEKGGDMRFAAANKILANRWLEKNGFGQAALPGRP